MNHFEEVNKTINDLLFNNTISSYRISKDSGVPYNNVHQLRNGKRKVENLSFKIIGQLYECAVHSADETKKQ
ncbi:hypothetical protein [Macrococcoides bohemicum]|uniref:hypothetical protein n=1 Tax=Macrococcoides bohemicum TaxID=1903056 RepID=UPI00165DF2D1|nr:hypothetical protein [Macrococcus bohemicus]MBC9873707.1 hypothetical protein [Macrococcus bohemicus]